MNFAEIRYRNVTAVDGGPIESIQYIKNIGYDGHDFFAKLKPDLVRENQNLKIYQDGGGQGTCFKSKSTAYYKAISEALEYWAFYEIKNNFSMTQKEMYGFNIDSTSTGMACFPGIFARSARHYAFNEAVERWSLIAWWDGILPTEKISNSVFEIMTPWKNLRTIVLKSSSLIHGKPIYGFACDTNIHMAIERAQSELHRNSRVIDKYYSNSHLKLESTMEKRLVYFSTTEGEKLFEEVIKNSFNIKNNIAAPKLIVDSQIKGPWNKYTFLWRCLFKPTSNHYLNHANQNFFFF